MRATNDGRTVGIGPPLRSRQGQLAAAREEDARQPVQRRGELPTTEEIKGYVADFRESLQIVTFPEQKALLRKFVKGIEVVGDEATLTHTIPTPADELTSEAASA